MRRLAYGIALAVLILLAIWAGVDAFQRMWALATPGGL